MHMCARIASGGVAAYVIVLELAIAMDEQQNNRNTKVSQG